MDKSSVYEKFTGYVDQLRNKECNQKQKISCFQHIAECIMSPAMAAQINYAAHCGTATNVLLLFCEDLDSVVRMSAEENLNKIFRALEKSRVSRILMDLYGEIKRNGNQRSLRICLNLFSYYAPQIKEKHIKWYAVRLLHSMSIISQRKETLLQETLCEFVKHFGRCVQQGLNDSETCKLLETFLGNIAADCAVKRRCSAQNCISLIEHARNKGLMAKHGLNKVIEMLLSDQQTSTVLGALGLLRLLLPQIIRGYSADYQDDGDSLGAGCSSRQPSTTATTTSTRRTSSECRQIIEIYDYCLHLLSTQHTTNHGIINAALEVINAILQSLDGVPAIAVAGVAARKGGECLSQSLHELLCNQQLQHNEYLRRRKSLKNQIFQLKNYEVPASQQQQRVIATTVGVAAAASSEQIQMQKNSNAKLQLQMQNCQQQQQHGQQSGSGSSTLAVGINAVVDDAAAAAAAAGLTADEVKKTTRKHIRNAARSISECVANISDDDDDDDDAGDGNNGDIADDGDDDVDDDMELLGDDECDGFTTLSQLNEPQEKATSTAVAAAVAKATATAVTLLTTKVDANDKLIDAENASSGLGTDDIAGLVLPKPQALAHQSSLQNLFASDDKSQHLSDIDNESFNSIDFDAEITIAGAQATDAATATTDKVNSDGSAADATTIGTFFNNLLSHSNAASESVSKLFRQSSNTTTPSKTTATAVASTDKSDAASLASLTLSLSSFASSSVSPHDRQPSIAETPTTLDDSGSVTASYTATASTAVLVDEPQPGQEQENEADFTLLRRKPNANPFLTESSSLKQTIVGLAQISVKIGSMLEQSLIYYTARLVSARFLLTGQAGELQLDLVTRVSIKSLSLCVVAQCVRLEASVLQLGLEITTAELLEETTSSATQASSAEGSPQSSDNSQLGADFEQLTAGAAAFQQPVDNANAALQLLDIKDDHFGPSTCDFLQQQLPLSRSADAALLQHQLETRRAGVSNQNKEVEDNLSRSEIIGSSHRATVAAEDAPPLALPPRPPKRTKSLRKSSGNVTTVMALQTPAAPAQALADVLLYHEHADPILRGGVQQIVGNFVQATGAGLALTLQRNLCLPHLLAILLKGFEDDIHTVVIQALNAFDKIFPHVVSKYLTAPPCHYHAHQQQQWQQQQQQHRQLQEQEQQQHQPEPEPEPHRLASGQQKRPVAASLAQTFGKQTFAKGQDNALSSQQQLKQQHEQREPGELQQQWVTSQQRNSNDGRSAGNDSRGQAVTLTTTMCAAAVAPATASATDNDELLAALLNDFQLQSNCMNDNNYNNNNHSNEPGPCCVFAISPKLLLNKLRHCHHNKYWLVQNKYAEVISNLNYVLLRSYYGNAACGFDNGCSTGEATEDQQPASGCSLSAVADNVDEDIVCTYEAQFLNELLHLLGDDDARVREHAAACLCRFIMQTSRQQPSFSNVTGNIDAIDGIDDEVNSKTQQTNFNLLWDFFDYRIFGSMSVTLRNLFRPNSTIAPPLAELDAVTAATVPTTTAAALAAAVDGAGPASATTAYFDGSYGVGFGVSIAANGIAEGRVFAFQRQIAQEEKVLAKVLYRMTNKLMTLNDKNLQFGIIYALRLLLKHFNFVDYQQAWLEFNFIEICMSYAYYNNATAADLNCQNDLMDVMGKLIAGDMLSVGGGHTGEQLNFLLRHSIKMLNIYYHVVTNQRPLQSSSSRTHKSDIFTLNSSNARELAALQALGYFGGDYVYMKLYNILRGANDSYKITINHEAGSLLICLLKSSLNALSLCLELQSPAEAATATPALKLIEEILQYLTKLINYAPGECVACLRQLLKYLFSQNYGSQVQRGDYNSAFIQPYLMAKCGASGAPINSKAMTGSAPMTTATTSATATATTSSAASMQNLIEPTDSQTTLATLFVQGLLHATSAPAEGDCVRLIKLFEPLVIYCLTLFMKSNAQIQAPVLELLSQLLELNVTYSILDSKNVIFEQILNNLDLIESGIDRNGLIIVPPMLKFLMQLTHKSDRQLISIPKIISITNNLLASGTVRHVALLALKTLCYELFFMRSQVDVALSAADYDNVQRAPCQSPLTATPTTATIEALQAQRRDLDTQKEVVVGMLEKFIESRVCQQVLALLLLYERLTESDEKRQLCTHDADAIYSVFCRQLSLGQLRVQSIGDLQLLECCFRNNGSNVLADSKEFLQLLQLFMEQSVGNFGDLAHATIILANVILKTEEIYLVNHIKLYLKNHPTAERRLLQSAAVAATPSCLALQDAMPSTSSAAAAARVAIGQSRPTISEINYFAKVLCEKLLDCCEALLLLGRRIASAPTAGGYCRLAERYVNALYNVCCRSRHKDALQSVFRLVLADSEFLCKYYNLMLMSVDVSGEHLDRLLLACLKLCLAMRLLDPLALLEQAGQLRLKWTMQRALLRAVCQSGAAHDWMPQQVHRLCAAKYLNYLIADHLEFLCELCKVRPECGSLLQAVLLQHSGRLNKHSTRGVLRLLWELYRATGGSADCLRQTLLLLRRLHQLHGGYRALQLPMERMARGMLDECGAVNQRSIYEQLLAESSDNGVESVQDELSTLLLQDWQQLQHDVEEEDALLKAAPRIIDESWLFAQLIKFATQHANAAQQQQQLTRLLLDIQSEPKLQRLFRNLGPKLEARLLSHALDGSLAAMLATFRHKCIQHTPHINYMQLSPLARVACALLMERVAATAEQGSSMPASTEQLHVTQALSTLLAAIHRIEDTALIYIDARIIEKFVGEHLLRPEHHATLQRYLGWLASHARLLLLQPVLLPDDESALGVLFSCLNALLQQRHVWRELNACEDHQLRCQLLQVLTLAARRTLQHTIFYQRHKLLSGMDDNSAPQAILLAKLIETQIDIEALHGGELLASKTAGAAALPFAGQELADVQVPLPLIASIGISLLRTHQFYGYAVTPHELILQQQHQFEQQAMLGAPTKQALMTSCSGGKLPTIPVDSLSDADVLRQFVKRLSIFGFTTRQQFEEYFMTFLLLINKVYDEHMVDQQEQFQIKQVCLQAIMELLMTYRTFPIVGGGRMASQFHHTTRWQRINCHSISLKKLHKVQLLIDTVNVFYQPNLERQLEQDNVIGTRNFAANQYDLNFSWAQMEAHAQPAGSHVALHDEADSSESSGRLTAVVQSLAPGDTAMRNYRHFTQQSGIDFGSSAQLVFDVLQQMIEQNHILVLPNLLKFCEICENRNQIKWIKERALKLQEQIPMDDTISHQHLIYLLCRTEALLIPSHGELQHLCTLIGNFYLKSSHCFIRNATLDGLLCLLECCSKTNTTIGKLSEELALLRDLIVGYTNRHGIIDESPLSFSDVHTKLVWTLNYSLIEWTSKFVPQCALLSNTIIAAGKFLKTTNNEELYLCVLHGLERIVVNSGNVGNAFAMPTAEQSGSASADAATVVAAAVVTPQLRHKIEKLALELLKMENEKFSIPALKLLLSCMYVGSAKQLENTELSNGIVQDDPEIIAQQNDKVDILLHCIKSSTRDAAWIYGEVLCQIIRDLVPPNEILTKVIKEFLAINQPHGDVIAMIVYQVFRSAIDSSFLQMLQDWLICTLPTFLDQPEQQAVWALSVIFLSASINLHLIKLFPLVLGVGASTPVPAACRPSTALVAVPRKLGQHEIALFVTAAQDFHAKLSAEQKLRFREAFKNYEQSSQVYARLLQRL